MVPFVTVKISQCCRSRSLGVWSNVVPKTKTKSKNHSGYHDAVMACYLKWHGQWCGPSVLLGTWAVRCRKDFPGDGARAIPDWGNDQQEKRSLGASVSSTLCYNFNLKSNNFIQFPDTEVNWNETVWTQLELNDMVCSHLTSLVGLVATMVAKIALSRRAAQALLWFGVPLVVLLSWKII